MPEFLPGWHLAPHPEHPWVILPTLAKSRIPKDHAPSAMGSPAMLQLPRGFPSAQLWGCPFSPGTWSHNLQLQLELGWDFLDFPQFPLISLEFRQFPMISLNFSFFVSISLNFPSFSSISLDLPRFPSISLNFPQFLLICLDLPQFPLISLNFY